MEFSTIKFSDTVIVSRLNADGTSTETMLIVRSTDAGSGEWIPCHIMTLDGKMITEAEVLSGAVTILSMEEWAAREAAQYGEQGRLVLLNARTLGTETVLFRRLEVINSEIIMTVEGYKGGYSETGATGHFGSLRLVEAGERLYQDTSYTNEYKIHKVTPA